MLTIIKDEKKVGEAVRDGHASAAALGSMVVYQKKGFGVLVNFPERSGLSAHNN